jgi:hypothetical protein
MTISGQPSKTDWERVRKSIQMDEPIPYDLTEANRVHPVLPAGILKIAKAS